MLRVILDRERAALSVRIDESHGNEVVGRVEFAPVGDGEGFVVDGVADRTPDVDDPDATFEEAGGVGGEVVVHAVDAGLVGLVDVDAFDGTAVGSGYAVGVVVQVAGSGESVQ